MTSAVALSAATRPAAFFAEVAVPFPRLQRRGNNKSGSRGERRPVGPFLLDGSQIPAAVCSAADEQALSLFRSRLHLLEPGSRRKRRLLPANVPFRPLYERCAPSLPKEAFASDGTSALTATQPPLLHLYVHTDRDRSIKPTGRPIWELEHDILLRCDVQPG